jgi:hypothetical protein
MLRRRRVACVERRDAASVAPISILVEVAAFGAPQLPADTDAAEWSTPVFLTLGANAQAGDLSAVGSLEVALQKQTSTDESAECESLFGCE